MPISAQLNKNSNVDLSTDDECVDSYYMARLSLLWAREWFSILFRPPGSCR